tara:strand:- start:305 stop:589 length:285 start_codon:yes stop_codon:yes gene_type:complete
MTYQIDKNVPIPKAKHGRKRGWDPKKILDQMGPGDSIEFSYDIDERTGEVRLDPRGTRYSQKGISFMSYCRANGVKTLRRSLDTGMRIWLTEKK